jgi:hypothetical protein
MVPETRQLMEVQISVITVLAALLIVVPERQCEASLKGSTAFLFDLCTHPLHLDLKKGG